MAKVQGSSGRFVGEIVGHRARIGYTAIGYVTELAPMYFYRIAPKGVVLSLPTRVADWKRFGDDYSRDDILAAARAFARVGCDLIMLGGLQVNPVRGFDEIEAFTKKLAAELDVPITSSYRAQANAFKALGSKRVATIHPFASSQDKPFEVRMQRHGLESAGVRGIGSNFIELPLIPRGAALQCARELKAADSTLDTIFCPNPNWSAMDDIDEIERELRVNVVTSLQAMIWESLRQCGIYDTVKGYGRLLSQN
jgi:maleate cis-trans isomerase